MSNVRKLRCNVRLGGKCFLRAIHVLSVQAAAGSQRILNDACVPNLQFLLIVQIVLNTQFAECSKKFEKPAVSLN